MATGWPCTPVGAGALAGVEGKLSVSTCGFLQTESRLLLKDDCLCVAAKLACHFCQTSGLDVSYVVYMLIHILSDSHVLLDVVCWTL